MPLTSHRGPHSPLALCLVPSKLTAQPQQHPWLRPWAWRRPAAPPDQVSKPPSALRHSKVLSGVTDPCTWGRDKSSIRALLKQLYTWSLASQRFWRLVTASAHPALTHGTVGTLPGHRVTETGCSPGCEQERPSHVSAEEGELPKHSPEGWLLGSTGTCPPPTPALSSCWLQYPPCPPTPFKDGVQGLGVPKQVYPLLNSRIAFRHVCGPEQM